MKKNYSPLVSVCITTHNRCQLLSYAVKSVLAQSLRDFELLLVDDGSTDGTYKFVKETLLPLDSRIRFLPITPNRGLAIARNLAISSATGAYFTFLDDDDYWDPNFLEKFVTFANKKESTTIYCCGTKYGSRSVFSPLQGSLREVLKLGYAPPVSAQFYPLALLKKVGGYNPKITSGVDHDLWLTLASHGVQILSLDCCLSYPNHLQHSLGRMTTKETSRIAGIKSSLELWKPLLIHLYGEDFYDRFCRAYLENVYRVLFIQSTKQGQISFALVYFIKMPRKFRFFKEMIKRSYLKLIKPAQKEYSAPALYLD